MDDNAAPALPLTVTPRAFRAVMGSFVTGVTVVIAGNGEALHAMTANAITALSLEPLLLIVCVSRNANLARYLRCGQPFSASILSQAQQSLATYFAGSWKAGPPPAFEFIPWQGHARLQGCTAAIGCEVCQLLEGGDHWIVVGRVVALYETAGPATPLVFYRGHYCALAPEATHESLAAG